MRALGGGVGAGWLGEALSGRQCGLQEVYFLRWELEGGRVGLHMVKTLVFRGRETWLGVPDLLFSSCVTLGKLLHLACLVSSSAKWGKERFL